MYSETMLRLIWQYPYTNTFWKDVSWRNSDKTDSEFSLDLQNLQFGVNFNNLYSAFLVI